MTNKFMSERLKAMGYEDERTAQIYAAKTGRPVKDVRRWMNAEKVFDTGAAIQNGLIQSVRALQMPADAFYHQVLI
jgi:ATP-dependent protease ClpP protease subunit